MIKEGKRVECWQLASGRYSADTSQKRRAIAVALSSIALPWPVEFTRF
jgi:hypothetical protein